MIKLTTTAPTRVDLAGGTLDIWPLHHMIPGCKTVNVAIDTINTVTTTTDSERFSIRSKDLAIESNALSYDKISTTGDLNLLWRLVKHFWSADLPSIRVESHALSPAGAGLGGSSSLALNLAYNLSMLRSKLDPAQNQVSTEKLVKIVRDIEVTQIGTPTGEQDYWAPVYGGINILSYPPGGIAIENIQNDFSRELEDWMLTVYSGQSRASAMNNWILYKCVFEGNQKVIDLFTQIAVAADDAAHAIRQANMSKFLEASQSEWRLRCKLFPGIQTDQTKKVSHLGNDLGAVFTRVCGAGGGGVMAMFLPPEKKQKALQTLNEKGYNVLNSKVFYDGIQHEASES